MALIINGMTAVMWRYLRYVLPAVDVEVAAWRERASQIPHSDLRSQALASLRWKKFHCQGGAVYVAGARPHRTAVLHYIVALQTISDYLDNLCDRAGVLDGAAFRLLHQAMLDAVSISNEIADANYYRLYPYGDDGGYLSALVHTCRNAATTLPYYAVVEPYIRDLVGLYCDLQVYKHIERSQRVPQLTAWFRRSWHGNSHIEWQEFAAACGSTLGMFALCHAAAGPERPDAQPLLDLYFPWMAGTHILLDYFIDLKEDREGGDLNFVSYYSDLDQAENRMVHLYREAKARLSLQTEPGVHRAALHGLLAMYLSDAKVGKQGQQRYARRMLRTGGSRSLGLYTLCCLYRRLPAGWLHEEYPATAGNAAQKETMP